VDCFGGYGLPNMSQPGQSEEIPLEKVRAAIAVARASQGLRRGRGRPFGVAVL